MLSWLIPPQYKAAAYVVLALLIVLSYVAANRVGYHQGREDVKVEWAKADAKADVEARQALEAATQVANAKAIEAQQLKYDIETQANEHARQNSIATSRLADLDSRLRLLAARNRQSSKNTVPGNSGTTSGGDDTESAPEWLVSAADGGMVKFTAELLKQADEVNAALIACQQWSEGIKDERRKK